MASLVCLKIRTVRTLLPLVWITGKFRACHRTTKIVSISLIDADFDRIPFRIYLYSVLHVNKGPINVYTGSKIEFFFVKVSEWPSGVLISFNCAKELHMF
jgi:hypothetical protein